MDDIDDAINALIDAQNEIQNLYDADSSLHGHLNPIYEDISRALRIIREIKDD